MSSVPRAAGLLLMAAALAALAARGGGGSGRGERLQLNRFQTSAKELQRRLGGASAKKGSERCHPSTTRVRGRDSASGCACSRARNRYAHTRVPAPQPERAGAARGRPGEEQHARAADPPAAPNKRRPQVHGAQRARGSASWHESAGSANKRPQARAGGSRDRHAATGQRQARTAERAPRPAAACSCRARSPAA